MNLNKTPYNLRSHSKKAESSPVLLFVPSTPIKSRSKKALPSPVELIIPPSSPYESPPSTPYYAPSSPCYNDELPPPPQDTDDDDDDIVSQFPPPSFRPYNPSSPYSWFP